MIKWKTRRQQNVGNILNSELDKAIDCPLQNQGNKQAFVKRACWEDQTDYVRGKQNVRDKFGTLEDNAWSIITQGFILTEVLNLTFSSVFTREDFSSLHTSQ